MRLIGAARLSPELADLWLEEAARRGHTDWDEAYRWIEEQLAAGRRRPT